MQTPQEFWRPIINDFDPVGSLVRPDEVARFFIDRKAADPTGSLVQWLKQNLRNSVGQATPYKGLLTGHVGSGKTWELMRLGQELAGDFFVAWFDAEFSLDPEKANHFDVLLGMGVAAYAAAERAGLKPAKRVAEDLVNSVANFVHKYEEREESSLKLDQLLQQVFAFALLGGAVGGPPGAVAAGAAAIGVQFLKAARLELNVKDELVGTLELPANRVEILGALNAVIEEVQQKANKPVLIIVDGLDKVPAARAPLLFAQSALLAEPACALLYAAPIEFYHRLAAGQARNRFDEYKILPNPPVHRRPLSGADWKVARVRNENGVDVMREVVAKRCESRGKSTDDLIDADALGLLAEASGGLMRDLIRSFRQAATFAQILGATRIDEDIARRVIDQQRQEIAPPLSVDHREALRRVIQQGALSGGQRQPVEDELLRSALLLSYEDDSGGTWFDAHPAVLSLL